MAKFITAQEAARLIPDGATVGLAGVGMSGWAEEIACAIRDNFRETGHPCRLDIKQASALGDWGVGNGFLGWDRTPRPGGPDRDHGVRGISRLGEAGEGLVAKWTAAHIGSAVAMNKLVQENKIQCHCLPQGVLVNLWREIAAGRPGLLTKVGLGTFVDPRLGGGAMNEVSDDELVKLVEFEGEEYLFYKSFPVHVAILRGTTADENGNISFEHESVLNESLAVAAAAKNSGGIVIVQVEYVTKRGVMNPKEVRIPGILVDYVVQATDPMACWQTEGTYFEPAFSGQMKKPMGALPRLPLGDRKILCRRCAMELHSGSVVNLGVGIPSDVASVVAEEGLSDSVTLTSETGAVGGTPAALPNFGSSYNAECIMTHNDMFDMIDGGGLDITVLGLAQADEAGNLNVSKFGPRLSGPGGFINITQSAKKVVFCGTFMAKSKERVEDGKLIIEEEGTVPKFIKQVEQVTFSGKYARPNQTILYVTERCVFQLIDGKMTLIEIAPGVDLEKDILAHMEFRPEISSDLKSMDPAIFREEWGGLAACMAQE
jgi:propionate CoA-transferase